MILDYYVITLLQYNDSVIFKVFSAVNFYEKHLKIDRNVTRTHLVNVDLTMFSSIISLI